MDTTDAPQIYEYISQSVAFTPYEARWLPYSSKAIICGQTPRMKGILKFMRLDQASLKEVFSIEFGSGFKSACFNYYFGDPTPGVALADTSGQLFIFDLESQKVRWEAQAHKAMANCIDSIGGKVGHGAVEVLSGGSDGRVKLWDARQSGAVLTLEPSEGLSIDCWCVGLGDSHCIESRVIAAGYDNGDVKLFDLRRAALLWEANLKNGVCGLEFDRRDIPLNKLLATTLEGKTHAFDLRTLHPESGFACAVANIGQRVTLWGVRHIPQNRDLLGTMGGDGLLRLYRYKYPTQRAVDDGKGRMKGVSGSLELINDSKLSEQPIVGWDWNNDKLGLAVCATLDQTVKVIICTRLQNYQ